MSPICSTSFSHVTLVSYHGGVYHDYGVATLLSVGAIDRKYLRWNTACRCKPSVESFRISDLQRYSRGHVTALGRDSGCPQEFYKIDNMFLILCWLQCLRRCPFYESDIYLRFQTSTVFEMFCSSFWANPRRLNFMYRRFWTPFSIFAGGVSTLHLLWRWNIQSVPKRRHIKYRHRGFTQKKEYNWYLFACEKF
jgi:hypothetical protein